MEIDEKNKKKRRVGRPKKRGPKKKRKSRAKPKPKIYKPKIKWDWKIVSVSNKKQLGYIGKYLRIEDAYAELEKLKEESNKVVFPKQYKNSYGIHSINFEYLLLEKNRYGDKINQKLTNNLGAYVEHISTNSKWIIVDKIPLKVEETFWVYGYDPVSDRKTFPWILENLVYQRILDKTDIKQILLYKNKVIINNENGIENFVICKNTSDAIRFYNLLEKQCKDNRQIMFLGDKSRISNARKDIEEKLLNKTGWTKLKIQRKTTRP